MRSLKLIFFKYESCAQIEFGIIPHKKFILPSVLDAELILVYTRCKRETRPVSSLKYKSNMSDWFCELLAIFRMPLTLTPVDGGKLERKPLHLNSIWPADSPAFKLNEANRIKPNSSRLVFKICSSIKNASVYLVPQKPPHFTQDP